MKETRVQVRLRTQFWAFVVAVKLRFCCCFLYPSCPGGRRGDGNGRERSRECALRQWDEQWDAGMRMYAAAAPDERTWENGTGSAGSLAVRRAQSATPNSETTKPPH